MNFSLFGCERTLLAKLIDGDRVTIYNRLDKQNFGYSACSKRLDRSHIVLQPAVWTTCICPSSAEWTTSICVARQSKLAIIMHI